MTGVQSSSWQRLTGQWEAAHAGTTPIEHRHDAGLIAAEVIVELRRMCDSGTYGALRATVGKDHLRTRTNQYHPRHRKR